MNRKKEYRFISYDIYFFLILFLLVSCSTKKNTFSRRAYHNLTSHYNAYWNGNESLKEGVINLSKQVKDNYNEILKVYNYGDKKDSKSIVTNCDRGIEKASKVIQNHSMIFHGKQYCKWIDDSYFLIGKSYFYKQEYGLAIRTFEFIIKEYKNTPISYEAMLWLARTYNQKGDFKNAQTWLDLLQSNIDKGKANSRLQKELELTYANHFILQKKYDKSKKHLLNALEFKLKKDLKIRVKFILAQIFQNEKYFEDASDYYRQVIKMNPVYDMAFQAKINLAKSYDTKSGDKEDIIKILKKMLKDGKNQNYLDQIYYALADIYLKDNNDTIAINYLKLSVSTSKTNRYQKAISSLKLADIYFSIPEYDLAQAYYDSTMQFLPKTYPDYKRLKTKTEILTNLVINLKVVKTQDSLQMLAKMPESERNKIIDKIILEKRKEEIRKLEETRLKQENISMFGPENKVKGSPGAATGGGWYFYNSSALSFGYSEFKKKWGNRKLEDNWRLKNKRIIAFNKPEEENDSEALDSITSDSVRANYSIIKNRKKYLENIPLSEDKLKISNDKIAEALFKLGFIYIDDLNEINKSIDMLETLLDRFPNDTVHALRTYYKLYKMYGELPDQEKRSFYKNLILSKYPDSNYAKYILDPDYYKKLESKNQKIADLYKETYNAFKRQQYNMVLIYCDDAMLNYKKNKLISKFEYLRDLSIGKLTTVDSLGILLKNFVKKYPKEEVTPLAKNILLYLYGDKQDEKEKNNKEKTEEEIFPYTFEPESIHFCVLIVNSRNVNTNAVKIKTSDYNYKYNKLDNLTISSVILNNKWQIINISSFKNSAKAFDYYNAFKDNEYVFSDVKKDDYKIFIVSKNNYKILYKDKNIEQYKRFFDKVYLSEKE
ncbi:MAG: tetratricopeptide repeat protein [Bacteroidales bacterium]|nr:tetratricopeptide repeat protein [Bacteroidales bacterium]